MSKPATPPRLEHLPNGTHHLLVDGAPCLLRAAELNNSSLSSGRYMKDVWPRLVHGNVNTVLGSVSWEQIEPDEGEYAFGELDEVLRDAREWGLKLVLLWFGAYKNGRRLCWPPLPTLLSSPYSTLLSLLYLLSILSSPLPTLLCSPLLSSPYIRPGLLVSVPI
jgi:hypothetical protein